MSESEVQNASGQALEASTSAFAGNQLPEKPAVLIIDDQSMIRLLCRKYLQHCGFQIIEAESGEKGIELCTQHNPDVILLDVNMPGIDGFTVCQHLREQVRYKTTPIVMLTGQDDLVSIQKAFDAGATDFMTKPVNWLILSHRIRYMIRAGYVLSQLHDSQIRLGAAQRMARIGNWEYDLDDQTMHWSDEVYRILGLSPGDVVPSLQAIWDLIPERELASIKAKIEQVVEGFESCVVEHHIQLAGDSERIIQQKCQICCDQKSHHRIITATIQDITSQRMSEEKIRHMALYDHLTGLPNRGHFKQLLEDLMLAAQHNRQLLGVLFIDIDRFKQVNDSLGHDVGDALLQAVGERLQECVRHADLIGHHSEPKQERVARIGGDEFTIILDNLRTPVDAAKTAKRIINAFKQPIKIQQHELFTSPSIGISVFPNDASTPDSLLKNADMAMYYAKNRGRNNFVFYSEPMNTHALERFNLESCMQKAVTNNEFIVFYQPKVNIQTGKLSGFEALVRWQHPDLGLVLPHNFVPLAEESGLINDIGLMVLRASCQQMKAWLDKGYQLEKIAVNFSPRQFLKSNLVDEIKSVLAETGLPSKYLEIEVTESIFMENTDDIITAMKHFKEMDIDIALDDFGTGFSSLNYLKRFPIDTLKIDKTFLKDIETDEENFTMIQTIIAMGRCLGLTVVAEGVETQGQLDTIKQLGCDIAQGYLYSKPATTEQADQFLLDYTQQAAVVK